MSRKSNSPYNASGMIRIIKLKKKLQRKGPLKSLIKSHKNSTNFKSLHTFRRSYRTPRGREGTARRSVRMPAGRPPPRATHLNMGPSIGSGPGGPGGPWWAWWAWPARARAGLCLCCYPTGTHEEVVVVADGAGGMLPRHRAHSLTHY